MSEDARIVVYVTDYCPYCVMAKRLLDARTIPYRVVEIQDDETRQNIVEQTGWRTVPVILLDDELIGGYMELASLDQSGELKKRLESA
ncbi:MAG: glutaredoxin [Myxococcales bacterium]|nr:glutaredoxin [Myxococcales bacterium]